MRAFFKTLCLVVLVFLGGCVSLATGKLSLPADVYFDKVYGDWQAIMVANHTGLIHEGHYLAEPSPENSIELVLPEEWSTDDDTAVEWVDQDGDGVRETPLLLLEDARTIGWTYPEDLTNAVWTKTNSAIQDDVVVAPDGAATGDKLHENEGGAPAVNVSTLGPMGVPQRDYAVSRTFNKGAGGGGAGSVQHYISRDAPTLTDDTEQAFLVLSGEGQMHIGGKVYPIKKGSVAYAPPTVEHDTQNTGSEPLVMMLIGVKLS